MMRSWRLVAVFFCALSAALGMGGCGGGVEDEILAAYQLGEDAIAGRDVVTLEATLSPDSRAMLEETLRMAREASVTETRQLRPSMLETVLALRNRVAPAELRSMTIGGLLAWEIEEEIMVVDAEWGGKPHSVMVSGHRAVIQMGEEMEVERSRTPRLGRRRGRLVGSIIMAAMSDGRENIVPIDGYTYTYVNVGGSWVRDMTEDMAIYDTMIEEAAKEQRKPVADYVAALEKERAGSLKPTVWLPVGK